MKKFVLIVTAVFVICLMICGIVLLTFSGTIFKENNNFNFSDWSSFIGEAGNYDEYTINESQSSMNSNYSKISASAVVSDIEVITWEEDTIKATFIGEISTKKGQPYLEMIEKGSTLVFNIKYPNQFWSIGSFTSNLKLYLYVPEDYNDSLILETVSGRITVADIEKIDRLTLDSVSGQLTAKNVNGTRLSVSSVSGYMELDNIYFGNTIFSSTSGKAVITGNPGEFDANSVSGSITANIYGQLSDINIDTVSGKAFITIDNDQSANVDMNSVSGNFNTNIPVSIINSSRSNMSFVIGDSASSDIDLSSVSGNLTVNIH